MSLRKVICLECTHLNWLTGKNAMRLHYEAIHPNLTKECEHCYNRFKTLSDYLSHSPNCEVSNAVKLEKAAADAAVAATVEDAKAAKLAAMAEETRIRAPSSLMLQTGPFLLPVDAEYNATMKAKIQLERERLQRHSSSSKLRKHPR